VKPSTYRRRSPRSPTHEADDANRNQADARRFGNGGRVDVRPKLRIQSVPVGKRDRTDGLILSILNDGLDACSHQRSECRAPFGIGEECHDERVTTTILRDGERIAQRTLNPARQGLKNIGLQIHGRRSGLRNKGDVFLKKRLASLVHRAVYASVFKESKCHDVRKIVELKHETGRESRTFEDAQKENQHEQETAASFHLNTPVKKNAVNDEPLYIKSRTWTCAFAMFTKSLHAQGD
jgi:hypothetical protein